jgi:hypothetical protein
MKTVHEHYERLFKPVVREYGSIDDNTITGIVGFGAGGPVSVCRTTSRKIYVTCELSLYASQHVSSDGIRFELLSRSSFGESATIAMLTALGNLSMSTDLGEGHTVDLTGALPELGITAVRLRLYSRVGVFRSKHGIYEVVPVERHGA